DRTVLKRAWLSETEAHDTYYVYDDFGDLRYVVPPAVTATVFTQTDAVFDQYIYGYRYDARRRLVMRKIPGKGWEYLIYNKNNQMVAIQDAVQRSKRPQEWTVTQYDGLGRVVRTALYTRAGTAGANYRAAVQQEVNAQETSNIWEERTGTAYTERA